MYPVVCALILWAAWYASWMIARSWSKQTLTRPARGADRPYIIIAYSGFVLLFASVVHLKVTPRLWNAPDAVRWCLVGLAAAGFGFCWWARIHLGRNWSWGVTRKEDHQIIDTGPYGLVRHPIYTGLILAAAATALLIAKATSLAGLLLIIVGFRIKARLEERFLSAELGESAYAEYAKRTGMLLPRL